MIQSMLYTVHIVPMYSVNDQIIPRLNKGFFSQSLLSEKKADVNEISCESLKLLSIIHISI